MTTEKNVSGSEKSDPNIESGTVAGFGDEWTRFDQSSLDPLEHKRLFEKYFSIFPWDSLPAAAIGFDLGCGSGRWARMVAPRVGTLHCIDASQDALAVAKRNLATAGNCVFHNASVDAIPLREGSMDFGFSLGVLHHVPDTKAGIESCVRLLKPGAPFLIYLYYAFDNRPSWFRLLWRASEFIRYSVSRLPHGFRYVVSQLIALLVYFPLARGALLLERTGMNVANLPLAFYRNCSFYVMRTDALDRFGTRLEQRFTVDQIRSMLEASGLIDVRFSDQSPYWCAVGFKARG